MFALEKHSGIRLLKNVRAASKELFSIISRTNVIAKMRVLSKSMIPYVLNAHLPNISTLSSNNAKTAKKVNNSTPQSIYASAQVPSPSKLKIPA